MSRGRILALAVLALPLVGGRVARAGECSHGGGDSSGGSSGGSSSSGGGYSSSDSSSSSSSSDSTATAEPTGCQEVSDVHGRSLCRDFGDGWAMSPRLPPIVIELGSFVRRLSPRLGSGGSGGHLAHELGDFSYRLVDPVAADDLATAVGTTMRVLVPTPYRIYAGGELELGGVVAEAPYQLEMAAPTDGGPRPDVTTRQVMYVGGAGVLGVRGRLGGAMLAAELAGGVRTVQIVVNSHLGACDIEDHHYATETFLEPRVRVDYWVNPWVALGAFAGGDLRGGGEVVGASLSLHVRAFDRGW